MKTLNSIMTILGGLLGTAYLLNLGAGIFELIPDNIPVIGNLDEAAATALVINCLLHLGKARKAKQERLKVRNDAE